MDPLDVSTTNLNLSTTTLNHSGVDSLSNVPAVTTPTGPKPALMLNQHLLDQIRAEGAKRSTSTVHANSGSSSSITRYEIEASASIDYTIQEDEEVFVFVFAITLQSAGLPTTTLIMAMMRPWCR